MAQSLPILAARRSTGHERPSGDVPALDRALDILERLGAEPAGQTLSQLSEQLRLPKSAVFRITQTLLARGYIAREESSQRFSLTRKLLTLCQPQRRDRSLAERALPAMRALRDVTRETVQLGVVSGVEGVIVEQVPGLHALRIAVDVGLRFPLHSNAPGKVLLAYSPAQLQSHWLRTLELTRFTERTITRRSELARECKRVRTHGFATDFAEADEGIHCVAAPVYDDLDQLLAAVWVSAPARRLPRENFPLVGDQVRRAAQAITLAWRDGT